MSTMISTFTTSREPEDQNLLFVKRTATETNVPHPTIAIIPHENVIPATYITEKDSPEMNASFAPNEIAPDRLEEIKYENSHNIVPIRQRISDVPTSTVYEQSSGLATNYKDILQIKQEGSYDTIVPEHAQFVTNLNNMQKYQSGRGMVPTVVHTNVPNHVLPPVYIPLCNVEIPGLPTSATSEFMAENSMQQKVYYQPSTVDHPRIDSWFKHERIQQLAQDENPMAADHPNIGPEIHNDRKIRPNRPCKNKLGPNS